MTTARADSESLSGTVAQRLRAAAFELFASRGLANVSIREIAERASVTSAVLYHYYESKEHLYEEILNERMSALHERLTAANDVTLEPVERVTQICGAFLDQFYDEGSGGTFVLRELLGLGAERFKETVGARDAQTRSYLRHALLEGMEAGIFRRVDSVLCSMAITAMLNSFARRHALGATISRDAALEQITDVYLAGLRPTAAP